jgi:hypothetical protein
VLTFNFFQKVEYLNGGMNTYFPAGIKKELYFWYLAPLIYLCLYATQLSAQIVITSPLKNQVNQRSLRDSALVAVTGYAYCPYNSIEVAVDGIARQGVTQKRQLTATELRRGFFHFELKLKSGWHKLKVTGIRPDGTRDADSVNRVGVGEVFLVAGNSNAMGLPNLGAKSASENVVSFDTVSKYLDKENMTVSPDEPMRTPVFSRFLSENFAYPSGETSWLWGELGDLLYQRFGTPVLFFNAAWAAANAKNYQESASGKDTYNKYVDNKFWQNRQPYTNIPLTLRYFHSWLGIRTVLWSHGENDAYHDNIDQVTYFNNIEYLIKRSREDFGFNVPWTIGMSSVTRDFDHPYPLVLQAQAQLASTPGFNTFFGPFTDTIQVPRPPSAHFENITGGVQGLSLAAKAWNRSLSDTVLKSMVPLQPKHFIYTGMVPGSAAPGATFAVSYAISDSTTYRPTVQAELLTRSGMFVAVIGTGKASPLSVTLPVGISAGEYRIRIVALNPVLVGSVSDAIEIRPGNMSVNYLRKFKVDQNDNQFELTWVLAAYPGLRTIALQKSPDHNAYVDLKQFAVTDNQTSSGVYAYSDTDTAKGSIYYRLKFEFADGKVAYSGALAIFRENPPPTFIVFPNPAEGFFFLRSDDPDTEYSLSLYDVSGRERPIQIDNRQVVGLTVVQPLYPLPKGIYFLKIKTGEKVSIQRVLFR